MDFLDWSFVVRVGLEDPSLSFFSFSCVFLLTIFNQFNFSTLEFSNLKDDLISEL